MMPAVRNDVLAAVHRLGVRRLTVDSRAVRAGDTFIAYPGESHDGRDYIAQAIANGAASVLWDAGGYAWDPLWRVPNLGVAHLRRQDFRKGPGHGAPWEVYGPNGQARQNPVYMASVALPYGILKRL